MRDEPIPKRFFRRCHRCGVITQRRSEPIQHCEHCAKPLSPFFYFNDQYVNIYADDKERPRANPGEYRPLWGLTACWTEEN